MIASMQVSIRRVIYMCHGLFSVADWKLYTPEVACNECAIYAPFVHTRVPEP